MELTAKKLEKLEKVLVRCLRERSENGETLTTAVRRAMAQGLGFENHHALVSRLEKDFEEKTAPAQEADNGVPGKEESESGPINIAQVINLVDQVRALYRDADGTGLDDDLAAVGQESLLAAYQTAISIGAEKVPLTLNVFDDAGVVVDSTTAELSLYQIEDIIDHAAQLVLVDRSHGMDSNYFETVYQDLEEALVVADVLPEADVE